MFNLLFSVVLWNPINLLANANKSTYNARIWSHLRLHSIWYEAEQELSNSDLKETTLYLKQSTGKLSDVLQAEHKVESELHLTLQFSPKPDGFLLAKVSLAQNQSNPTFSFVADVLPDIRNDYRFNLTENAHLDLTIQISKNYSTEEMCDRFKQKGLPARQLPESCLSD